MERDGSVQVEGRQRIAEHGRVSRSFSCTRNFESATIRRNGKKDHYETDRNGPIDHRRAYICGGEMRMSSCCRKRTWSAHDVIPTFCLHGIRFLLTTFSLSSNSCTPRLNLIILRPAVVYGLGAQGGLSKCHIIIN